MNAPQDIDSQTATPSGSTDQATGQQSLFMSPHCSIRAHGVFEAVTHAAGSGPTERRAFMDTVNQAMSRARQAGIANPVIIGAIPFDTRQPSSLIIPRSYEVFSRQLTPPPQQQLSAQLQALATTSYPDEGRFKQGVQQAIANFQLSDIRKTVLSRILEVELNDSANVSDIFARLVQQNPTGFHFQLPLPDGSELIGASPELLIRREGNRIISNPLAGSARRQDDEQADREVSEALMQSGKDTYEHRLVIDDIRQQLSPVCSELNIPDGPSLLNTPTMWHLSTTIDGELADPSISALELACRLHPTPAVCGFPTGLAHKLIDLVEPFERGMFSGMVGWCDGQGNGEWVVTIRCGRVQQNRIQLFAGAGIVEDSCPESEWRETQAKLQTMLNALGVKLDNADARTTPPAEDAK
ncbi:MAG: isochorismate synthase [Marinobacterium sp.]|nr:isochorismate synthase [Marinobacterium sp.]